MSWQLSRVLNDVALSACGAHECCERRCNNDDSPQFALPLVQDRIECSCRDVRSIWQRVQNGQFFRSLALNASHLLIASYADKGLERLLVRVIGTGFGDRSDV